MLIERVYLDNTYHTTKGGMILPTPSSLQAGAGVCGVGAGAAFGLRAWPSRTLDGCEIHFAPKKPWETLVSCYLQENHRSTVSKCRILSIHSVEDCEGNTPIRREKSGRCLLLPWAFSQMPGGFFVGKQESAPFLLVELEGEPLPNKRKKGHQRATEGLKGTNPLNKDMGNF